MTELQASRTLVKSPPELWAECSDAASLARHLDRFGDIRITRLEPETAVAWEGERARGTVRIEPAGWGTKVILTAVAEGEEAVVRDEEAVVRDEEAVVRDDEAVARDEEAVARDEEAVVRDERPPDPPEPETPLASKPGDAPGQAPPPPRKRRFARLRAYWRGESSAEPEPPAAVAVVQSPTADPPPSTPDPPPSTLEADPPTPEAAPPAVSDTEAALASALDSLGQAHHRPYSRA
jgi:hypothetical protein